MGVINESTARLKKNVDHINDGMAIHPVHAHTHVTAAKETGKEIYKRFYGAKKP